jgi:hypothetical protein
MADVATFGGQCGTWGTVCNQWSECISEVVEILGGGARDPQEWHDPPFYEELEKYQQKYPQKKEILIKIYVKCASKKYNKTITVSDKKINVSVDDIKFMLKTLNEVGVDIKNIRKYRDDDLDRLLS